MTQTLKTLPLSALYLHDLNPRKATSPEDEAAMAESIRTGNGLIYNLAGFDDPAHPDQVGIVDGGRRLRGLLALTASHPDLTDIHGAIAVNVTDDLELAMAWAVTGNNQLAQEPADEIRAYGRMNKQGMPITVIAAQCAVTEAQVKRRLALANLPNQVLDALKDRKINLSVAQALTNAQGKTKTLEYLAACIENDWNQHQVERALKDDNVSGNDRRVLFVGLEAYEAAGGALTRDLFSDATYLHDEEKLEWLFAEKLHQVAKDAEGEGWAFVWFTDGPAYDDERLAKTEQTDPTPATLPEADQAELDQLNEGYRWNLDDTQRTRLKELETRARGDYTDEQRASTGLLLYVDNAGALQRKEGLRDKAAANTDQEDDNGADNGPITSAKEDTPSLSETLRTDLAAIALRARQTAAMDRPELMLDLLAYQLSQPRSFGKTLALDLGHPTNTPSIDDGLLEDGRLPQDSGEMPGRMATDAFLAFQAQGKKHRNRILTEAIARQINQGANDIDQHLNRLTDVTVRKIWTPTTKNFFGRMRGPHLDAIWAEIFAGHDDDRDAAWPSLKVKDKARELGDLFNNSEVQEAYGLSRAQIATIDAWTPQEIALATKHEAAPVGAPEDIAAE